MYVYIKQQNLLKYTCVKDQIKQKTHFCKIAIFQYVK